MRITQRRRSTHDSKTRCAWHPRCASLGVPPTAQRSGVVGVLIRIQSNSQALTGYHASFPTHRDEACFALQGSKHGAPACGSMAMRITQRRRSTHPGAPGKTRCAWHRCGVSLGVPPTAERSGVVGVLIRILSNSQALTGCHASFPTGRDEACFALSGQSMTPTCGSMAMRITR